MYPTPRVLTGLLLLAGCATAGGEPDASEEPGQDAAQGTIDARQFPDAMPGTPDAMPGTPDAMPGMPDAMPPACTVQTINMLANPAFDAGAASWVESGAGYPIILSPTDPTYPLPVAPHTGNFAAWLGGVNGASRSIHQEVAIPASSTAITLSGQRWVATEEAGGIYDTLLVQIQTAGGGSLLATPFSWNNNNTTTVWTAFSAGLTNYAGQTIRVRLVSAQDSTLNTNFFFDTLVLNVTACL